MGDYVNYGAAGGGGGGYTGGDGGNGPEDEPQGFGVTGGQGGASNWTPDFDGSNLSFISDFNHQDQKNVGLAGIDGEVQITNSAYQTTFFAYTGGVVYYTIPTTGTYEVDATGAQGGGAYYYETLGEGGAGALVDEYFNFTAGLELEIVVGGGGQPGSAYGFAGGGGGRRRQFRVCGHNRRHAVPVPETPAWIMALVGFGVVGAAARRAGRQPRPA